MLVIWNSNAYFGNQIKDIIFNDVINLLLKLTE